jgi:hypothetical protein
MRKAGDQRCAQQIEGRLDRMGNRHPEYLRNRANNGRD